MGRLGRAAVLLVLFSVPHARAQQGGLELIAGASYSLPPASVTAESTPYIDLGARFLAPIGRSASWYVGGFSGLSLISEGASWISGTTGGWWTVPVSGHLFLDLQAAGEMFSVGDPWPYRAALVQGEPALRWEAGTFTARAAMWGGVGTSWVEVIDSVRVHGQQRSTEIQSDLWSWGGRVQGTFRAAGVEPWIGLEAYTAPQGEYVGGRCGLRVPMFHGVLDLSLGVWDTPDGSDVQAAAGIRLPLGRDLSMRAFGGRFGPDPLLDTPVAGSAGVTVGWTALRIDGEERSVVSITAGAPPSVVFRVAPENASSVSLVGSFADWEPLPMARRGDEWITVVPVPPGLHRFGFLVDGEWYLPDGLPGTSEDDWGRMQASILVPGS